MEDPDTKIAGKILGIGGSPRKGGNSDLLMKHILKGARKKNIECKGIHLRDYQFQPCVGCEQCRKDGRCTKLHDGMQLVYPDLLSSQGLVLACPTHNYNVTAWMKAFIDRLYCFYAFTNDRPRAWSSRLANQGRKAVIAAICEQPEPENMGFTLEAMRLPLKALGYEILGELPVLGIFDKGKVGEKPEILAQAEALGAKLGEAL